MKNILDYIFAVALLALIVIALIFGLVKLTSAWNDIMAENIRMRGQEKCDFLATNANIKTQYTDTCRILICGNAWVETTNLPYHINQLENGCN